MVMRTIFKSLNILFIALGLVLCVYYDVEGGLTLKGVTASAFVLLGLVNLVYGIAIDAKDKRYSIWMAAGLLTCMIGDIVLNIEFIFGALIFALGHVLYCVALCALRKPSNGDVIPIAAVFAVSVMIIELLPILDFGSALMEWICIGYALVISCMVGKSVSNFARQPDRVTKLVMAGAILFWFSDLMLVLCRFGDAPKITDTMCLYTYFPAQILLAHSVYQDLNRSTER